MCVDSTGNALVVFRRLSDLDLHGQRYDSTGAPLGTEFQVANIDSSSYFEAAIAGHAVSCEDISLIDDGQRRAAIPVQLH